MAFNRSSVNLGNQFAHAAAVSRGDEKENTNRTRQYFKIPSGMKSHKWSEKEERFNILLAKNNASDPDSTGYKFYKSVQVHELPNLADPKHPHQYPCLKILGRACPCCERKEQMDDGTKGGENWERIKPFIPKERVIYYLNPEGTSDILVHECAARQKGEAAFPQRLMAQATAMSDGTLPIPFASPNEDGRIVKVNTAKDSFNGNEFYSASAVNFFQRKELPADELYERCMPWNEILNFGTYEEMERVMNGGEPDGVESAVPARHTEAEKQAEFERACEQTLPPEHYRHPDQPAQSPAGTFRQDQPSSAFQQAPASQPPQGFRSSPVNGPLTEDDFKRDPYSAPARSFPAEQTQPQTQAGGCPFGLRLGTDFETSRKCCNCGNYEACREARRNG